MSANIPSTLKNKNLSQGMMQSSGKTVRRLGQLKGQGRPRLEQNCWGWIKVASTFLRWPSISTAPCSTSLATDFSGAWWQSRIVHGHPGPMVMFIYPALCSFCLVYMGQGSLQTPDTVPQFKLCDLVVGMYTILNALSSLSWDLTYFFKSNWK